MCAARWRRSCHGELEAGTDFAEAMGQQQPDFVEDPAEGAVLDLGALLHVVEGIGDLVQADGQAADGVGVARSGADGAIFVVGGG